MTDVEKVERVRQEIMRFRELLTIMRQQQEAGERLYAKLFAGFSEEEKAATKEKDLQWKLAEQIEGDLSALNKAVLQMQFAARDLERNFEQLHHLIYETESAEAE